MLSSSEDISSGQLFPDDLNPYCDFDIEDSNPKLAQNTPTCDDTPFIPNLVANGSNIQEIWKKKLFLEDLSPY